MSSVGKQNSEEKPKHQKNPQNKQTIKGKKRKSIKN